VWKTAFVIITSLFVGDRLTKKWRNEHHYDEIGPTEPWESMTIPEKLSHLRSMPMKDLTVLITAVYATTSLARTWVDYKTK